MYLRVSSINKVKSNNSSDTPFSISGILFEFTDMTQLLEDLPLTKQLFDQLISTQSDTALTDDNWDSP